MTASLGKDKVIVNTQAVFGLGDLSAVRFRCAQCSNYVVKNLGDGAEMPKTCPFCGNSWTTLRGYGTRTHRLVEMIEEILDEPQGSVDILFEVDLQDEDVEVKNGTERTG